MVTLPGPPDDGLGFQNRKATGLLVMLVGSRLHREATPGALGISSNNGDSGFSRLFTVPIVLISA